MTGTRYIVATDVGGTCTDTIVVTSTGEIHIGKALSTPPRLRRWRVELDPVRR